MSGYDYLSLGDYPFLAVEVCPECDTTCVAVIERVITPPEYGPGGRYGSIRTQLTILEICDHFGEDEAEADYDEEQDCE